ncbi:MAG: ligD [Flavipsychrobacter sp.]|jgi:bifunctional non-homologous end joining protein LigD|nr:ligD [Flavipsychrobacter sp.]
MLAKLHDKAFDREGWIFEIKWDGYRAVAEVNGKNSRLYSRNGLAFENEYAVVFEELKRIKKKMVLDGEIVAFGENGMPSFQAIQQYDPATTPLVYYVFDILSLNGKSLKNSPLLERKQILKDLLPESDIIKYCDHVEDNGKEFFELMQKQGLEGMIAKRSDSRYIEDSRSSDWLKVKHMLTDEAVIAGYTAPRGGRNYFGALILGSYENGRLKYIGHTGTGFNQKTLKEVYGKLQDLVTDTSPFEDKIKVNSPVTWVKPKLVCNLKFTEVTADGNRRHPVFMGLRKDKAAKEVKLEAPVETEKAEPVTVEQKAMQKTTTISGKKLPLTNLDKVYWPEEGYTKGDVINYYSEMAKHMIKYLKGRPQSLMRTPNGITGGAFYHKDAGENAPDWMETYPVWSDSSNKTVDYLLCNDKPSLLYIANLGCIEINPWNSTIKKPDHPDYFIMDIDPSEKNSFDQVIECAQVIKEILDKAGAESYCKTSGSTGLHIYVPLGAKYTYEEAKQFAEMIAQFAQEQLPGFTTLERSLSKRGKDRIYIDYLQNRRGQTLSSVYSLRPKPGAPVSTPLEWKEVKKGLQPTDFNIENIFKRIEKKGDLFAPVLGKGIDMLKAIKKLSE